VDAVIHQLSMLEPDELSRHILRGGFGVLR
jgi:hypothetical protein